MNTVTTLSMINAQPNDLDLAFAQRAHNNISMFPERRARQCQDEYMAEMAHIEAEFAPFATTPEAIDQLKAALEDYRQGYLRHQRSILEARSRTASSMVTGPSKFPTARNQKRLDTEQRRYNEFTQWRGLQYKRLHEQFNPQEPRAISSDRDDAVDALRTKLAQAEKLQATMVAANKIIRSKADDDTKIARMVSECGFGDTVARQLLKPDVMGRGGFADFQLKNNGAEIRRLRSRIDEVQAQQARPERRADFNGGYVLDNPDNNRVQIFYDTKPSSDVIAKLKRKGFKWAHRLGAWQRQRTVAGIYAAQQITGVKFA